MEPHPNAWGRIAMTTGMRIRTHRLVLSTLVAFAGFMWIALPAGAQMQPVATSTAEAPPIPQAHIPSDITSAINSPELPAAANAPDAWRTPRQLLAVYEIIPRS